MVLKNGQISESGTYKELLDKKGDFADFLILHMQEESTDNTVDESGMKNILNILIDSNVIYLLLIF